MMKLNLPINDATRDIDKSISALNRIRKDEELITRLKNIDYAINSFFKKNDL